MRVSRNSWHYRLTDDIFWVDDRINLCKYFWLVVASIIVCFIVIPFKYVREQFGEPYDNIASLALAGVYIGTVFAIIALINNIRIDIVLFLFALPVIILGVISGALAGIVIGINAYDNRTNYGRQSFWNPERESNKYKIKEHKPNLLLEFIRAKKGKYCPRIEFTEDN